MSSDEETAVELTREQYSEFIRQIELRDIWLNEASVSNNHGPLTPVDVTVQFDSDASYVLRENGFRASHQYRVRFESPDSLLAQIEIRFGLDFLSSTPISDQIFSVFKDVNLPVNTWPFLREFVATTLGRMGWSPFTIPAFKTNVGRSKDDPKSESKTKKRRQTRAKPHPKTSDEDGV